MNGTMAGQLNIFPDDRIVWLEGGRAAEHFEHGQCLNEQPKGPPPFGDTPPPTPLAPIFASEREKSQSRLLLWPIDISQRELYSEPRKSSGKALTDF